ncbi:MAG: transglycosylase domain-containing protein, partial [Anaerolinea sp.]|nr:transglycosylase domain-containing protein [Anaerolinea sp.]
MPDQPLSPDDAQAESSSANTMSEGGEQSMSADDANLHRDPTIDMPSTASDLHDKPTLPLPEDSLPEAPADLPESPRMNVRTLAGSGGLDPNPDFEPPVKDDDTPAMFGEGVTMPHIVPFEHTMVHVPGENPLPPRQPRPVPQNRTQPAPQNAPQRVEQRYTPQPPQATIPAPPTTPGLTNPGAPMQQGIPVQSGLPPRNPPARRRGFLGCSPGCLMVFAGLFVTFCGGLTLIMIILTATLGTRLEEQLTARVANFDTYQNFQSTFYYDRNGALLYEAFNEGRRTNVQFEQFPQDLINATVATEDGSFWSNPGFEVQATVRGFLGFVGLSDESGGGSTITQQLVRNVLFDPEYRAERSVNRKVEEIL